MLHPAFRSFRSRLAIQIPRVPCMAYCTIRILVRPFPVPPGSGIPAPHTAQGLHHGVLVRSGPGPWEEVVDDVPQCRRVVRGRDPSSPPRLPEDPQVVAVHRRRTHDLRLVPLPLIGHLGQVHRGLDDHVACLGRPDLVDQHVLGVRCAAPATAGTATLAREAHPVSRLANRGVREPGSEAVTQPPPGSVVAIRSAGRNDLDTDAASMGAHQSPGDLLVVEGPGRDADRPVARPRNTPVTRAAPRAADGREQPRPDGALHAPRPVGIAEVASGRRRVGKRWPADSRDRDLVRALCGPRRRCRPGGAACAARDCACARSGGTSSEPGRASSPCTACEKSLRPEPWPGSPRRERSHARARAVRALRTATARARLACAARARCARRT